MKTNFYLRTKKVWREISNGTVKLVHPVNFDQRLINSIFHVGEYYYYILDLTQGRFLHISPEIEMILGLPVEIQTDAFLERIHPEDMPYFLGFERKAKDFFRNLKISQILHYKISFDFRIMKANGSYCRLLHQVVCLNHCERGHPLQSLGVHTDISHIKSEGEPKLSFIGMNGEPSFYGYDSSPDDSWPLGASETTTFTKRELEIIRLIAQGLKSSEIAVQLHISEHTVKTHRKNIIGKSQLSISQLIGKAVREGWI